MHFYGERRQRTFREAATRHLREGSHRASIEDDAAHLKQLDPWIGELPLEAVHSGSLEPFIHHRQAQGRRNKTINIALGVVRSILNKAASEWLDEQGRPWLPAPPKIRMLPTGDSRKPRPLSWDEQTELFQLLPGHLQAMCLFKVNTGTREQEVCGLRWEWEHRIKEIDARVFVVPGEQVKNREPRLIVLNSVARSVVDAQRGNHDEYVFTYKGQPVGEINNTGWQNARRKSGIQVRVHDLKHTFGRRLRAAGVSLETRKALLGHTNGDITTHYSAPEIEELMTAAEKVCEAERRGLTMLRVVG